MQFRNEGEPMAPAYFRNMSGLLLAFVVLSALAHGVSLLFSSEPIVPLAEHRFGATVISTVLAPANDKPAATPSPQKQRPSPQEKRPASQKQQSSKTDEPSKAAKNISTISVARKTEFKTNSDTRPETEQSQLQHEAQRELQRKPQQKLQESPQDAPSIMAASNNTTSSTSESAASQLDKQRNYLLGELQSRLNRYLVYPIRARKRGWQGQVIVSFNINERGQLNNVRLAKSSGYSLLDRSAITAIDKLNHIALPDSMGRLQAMELQLPVRYELRES